MNRFRLFLIAGLFVTTETVSAAQNKPPIPLPSDPSAAIITLDWKGGYGVSPTNTRPVLTIRADGRVTVIDPSGKPGDKESVLSAAEIQELLRFAITDQDFFAFDLIDMKKTSVVDPATGMVMQTSDASVTVVRIKTADMEKEVRYVALSFWAQRYPKSVPVGHLRAIEVRLTQLIEDVKAGRK